MEPISLKPKKRSDDYMSQMASLDEGCPTVYLSGDKELASLPKEGTITFRYCRKELTMRDGDDKPVRTVLELEAILDAAEETDGVEDEEDDEADYDTAEALDRSFKKATGQDEEIED